MKNYKKPLWIAMLVVSVSALMGSVFLHGALAATAQIYLSPGSASVMNQATTSVAVRINPGTVVTNVQAVVTYDASKFDFIGIDASGSAFESALGSQTGGSGTVTIRRGSFSGGVSTDSLVANVTFKAVVGTGTSSIGLSPAPDTDSFDTNGDSIGATLTGTTMTLTTPPATTVPTPAQTCATGQTGTYPNCVTPVKTSTGTSPAVPSAGGSTKPTPTTTTTPTIAGAPKVTHTLAAQYSQATVAVTTDVPTRAYIKYGLASNNLSITTPLSDLATSHTLSLNPTTLVPGETYYYSVVATNAAGTVTESTVAQIKLKGLLLKVNVLDQNHKPLKNTVVTLHSTPQTAQTDAKGYVTLQDITPGTHHLVYSTNKKTYTQEIQVVNNIVTDGATQSAPVQNFSIIYPFTQSSFVWQRTAAIVAAIVIVLVGAFIFIRRQRQLVGQPVLVSQSKVVTASEGPLAPLPATSVPTDNSASRGEQLQQLSGVPVMHPGATISPRTDSEEKGNN